MNSRPLKRGDVREDGYVFHQYHHKGYELWKSPQAWHRLNCARACTQAKQRAAEIGCQFDLDTEYLISIYPVDGLCPILRTALVWGGGAGSFTSPSLDRVIPDKGYTKGNVAFISQRANRIKSDATAAELTAVLNYLKVNT